MTKSFNCLQNTQTKTAPDQKISTAQDNCLFYQQRPRLKKSKSQTYPIMDEHSPLVTNIGLDILVFSLADCKQKSSTAQINRGIPRLSGFHSDKSEETYQWAGSFPADNRHSGVV